MHKVEIILATFNSETFIEEQIDSILAQTYQNWHLTIQDGGSCDGTENILNKIEKKYRNKITFIPNNGGRLTAKENFSTLLSKVDAPFYMFCDQDDVWFEDKIEKTLDYYFLKNASGVKQPSLIFTDSIVTDEKLTPLCSSFLKLEKLNPEKLALKNLLLQNVAPGNTMLFNRELKELALPIPAQAVMHDHWLMLVCSIFGMIHFMNAPTLYYRQHQKNVVGATRVSAISALRKLSKDPHKFTLSLEKNFEQAKALYEIYGSSLPFEAEEIVKFFINIRSQGYLKRRISLLEKGFFKHGLLRNLGLLLLI